MAQITTQQLTELLIGIGRAQAAIIQGLENAMPGVRGTHITTALQNAAHLRDHPDPTLVDLPVRVAMASLTRNGPDPELIQRDLDRLLSGEAVTTPGTPTDARAAAAAATRPAAPPAAKPAAAPAAKPAAPAAGAAPKPAAAPTAAKPAAGAKSGENLDVSGPG